MKSHEIPIEQASNLQTEPNISGTKQRMKTYLPTFPLAARHHLYSDSKGCSQEISCADTWSRPISAMRCVMRLVGMHCAAVPFHRVQAWPGERWKGGSRGDHGRIFRAASWWIQTCLASISCPRPIFFCLFYQSLRLLFPWGNLDESRFPPIMVQSKMGHLTTSSWKNGWNHLQLRHACHKVWICVSPGEDVVAERRFIINMKVLMKAMRKMMVGRQLSNEKKPWLFRAYRGLYCQIMRGL